MTPDTTITLGFIIAIIGCGITLWNFFQSYKRSIKQDEQDRDKASDGLKEGISELSGNVRELNTSVLKMNFKTDSMCDQVTNISVSIAAMKNDITVLREEQIRHDMRLQALEEEHNNVQIHNTDTTIQTPRDS